MNIKFFEDNFIKAIKSGIYEIYIQANDKEELLYIGESVFVLARCSIHLYEISKGSGYLGFTNERFEDDNITLVFRLYDSINDAELRKKTEKKLIADKRPIMQSGISDRVKSIDKMIEELTIFLNK